MASQSAKLNSTQKNVVRVALAAGATIATLMGAQTLAFSSNNSTAATPAPAVVQSSNTNADNTNSDNGYTSADSNNYVQADTLNQIYSSSSQPNPYSRSSRP